MLMQQSIAEWLTVADQLDEALCVLDESCRIVQANRAFGNLCDAEPLTLIGEDFSQRWRHLDESLPTIASGNALRYATANQAVLSEVGAVFPADDARASSILLSVAPLPLADASHLSLVLLRDITSITHAFQALQQSRARFDAVFQAGVGIVLVDLDGKILRTNPAWEDLIGRDDAALRGSRFSDLIVVDDRERAIELFTALVSRDNPRQRYTHEARFTHVSGAVVWVQMVVTLMRDLNEQPRRVIAVLEDITARREAESELREVKRQLGRSRTVERLRLAQALHDGPMQDLYAAQFLLQKLRRRLSGSDEPLAETIQATVTQVNDTLRRITSELRPPTLVPFGLEVAIRAFVDTFSERYPDLKVHLDVMKDGQTLPEHVRLSLFRIVQEALNNVARHAEATNVSIAFIMSEHEMHLSIQDDGRGFTVPERWVTLARQGHYGLLGAVERAEEIDGVLTVTSAPVKGTTLRVIVPLPVRQPVEGETDG